MERKNIHISSILLIALILISPFIQSINDTDKADLFSINVLPPIVSQITGSIRWIIFGCSVFLLFGSLKKYWVGIDKRYLLIFGFYAIQFLYAFATQVDVWRYVGLSVISLSIPFLTYVAITNNRAATLTYLQYSIYLVVSLSLITNIGMIATGMRFQGFSNNSNLFGITAVFWLTLLLIRDSKPKMEKINSFFVLVVLLTLVLSGSRNAMFGAFIVLIFHFGSNLKSVLIPGLSFVISIFILVSIFDLHAITDRLLNFENAVEDSGRSVLWESVFPHIKMNLLWGNGMDSNMRLANSGNMHNCYIRYLLNMGLVFSLLSFMFYIIYIVTTILFKWNTIPRCLIGYLLAYTFWNIGEDFYVGIGSSIFIFFNVIIGLITFYSRPNLGLLK